MLRETRHDSLPAGGQDPLSLENLKMYLSNSELRQLDLLKKKTPVERFLLMAQLIAGQIEAMKAAIKQQNPNLDEKGLKQCFKERMFKIYSTEQKGKYK